MVRKTRDSLKFHKPNLDTLFCPECGGLMVLKESKYGKFYGCINFPKCKGAHGAHPDGRPLGFPGNAETKKWRKKAHKIMDEWIKITGCNRDDAYIQLKRLMNMSEKRAHIGKFNIDECKRTISAFESEIKALKE